ncbi:MAG TPA: RNA methyltransferase [Anaerolineales bacterium]|jgi:TrmH family RNA methyltransferase|nr:RNA methyltransferase [Anaerolineales bacterium]
MISSNQNPKIKLARALSGRPKERREASAFLAEGVRLVEEAVAANWPFRFVLYSDELTERGNELVKKLEDKKVEIEKVESSLLQSMSETETSQGILAILNHVPLSIPQSPNFVLILDTIRDPGNLGTLLRSADAAGVQAVLIPPETTDAFAPKVVRAGMGAHFRLPIQSMSWDQIREFISVPHADPLRPAYGGDTSPKSATDLGEAGGGLKVFLADMDGQSCWETDLRAPLALIVGGEAEGASEQARKLANALVKIPMAGKTESLNAAVAGSVLMFEVLRQRSNEAK